MHARLRFTLLLPLALMLTALIDTPFHVLWKGGLSGVLGAVTAPKLSARSFWDGSFQTEFEAWFEQELSPKAALVRLDNTLNLLAFHDISAHTGVPIVLGKHHTLFELSYINNLNAVSELKGDLPPKTAYSTDESVRLIGRAARAFKLLRIDLMIVFYPVKAVIWSDRVPGKFRLPGGAEKQAAGYADLLSRLQAAEVPVVDGAGIFSRIARETPRFPLYNSGGTHWTNAGACEVSKKIVAELTHANVGHATLRCRAGKSAPAVLVDTDLALLSNVWDISRFQDPVPEISPTLSAPLRGGPRNVWVVGTSYSGHIIGLLTEAGVFRNVYREFYYRRGGAPALDWRELAKASVVILEQSQWSYLTANLTDFIDDLRKHSPRFAKALREVDAEQAAASTAPALPAP